MENNINCKIIPRLENLYSELREMLEQKYDRKILLLTEKDNSNYSDIVINTSKVSRIIKSLVMNIINRMENDYIIIGHYHSI